MDPVSAARYPKRWRHAAPFHDAEGCPDCHRVLDEQPLARPKDPARSRTGQYMRRLRRRANADRHGSDQG